MSQAVQKPEFEPDYEALTESEFYQAKVNNPEEIRAIQAYALENEATFLIDYEMDPSISVDVLGDAENDKNYNRLLGGGKEPIDSGSRAIITSSMECFQNFKHTIKDSLEKYWDHEDDLELPERTDNMPAKDIYLDTDSGQFQPKVIRSAANLNGQQLYGALWRTERPSNELYKLMEEEGLESQEWEQNAYPVEGEIGQEFWEDIAAEAEEIQPEKLLESSEPGEWDRNLSNDSKWCATEIGRETTNKRTPGWPIGDIASR